MRILTRIALAVAIFVIGVLTAPLFAIFPTDLEDDQ